MMMTMHYVGCSPPLPPGFGRGFQVCVYCCASSLSVFVFVFLTVLPPPPSCTPSFLDDFLYNQGDTQRARVQAFHTRTRTRAPLAAAAAPVTTL